jgi:hypothetical protein
LWSRWREQLPLSYTSPNEPRIQPPRVLEEFGFHKSVDQFVSAELVPTWAFFTVRSRSLDVSSSGLGAGTMTTGSCYWIDGSCRPKPDSFGHLF